jgi:imidazolonepropionase-like amidohydrolase
VRSQIAAGADVVKFYADYRWGPGEPSRATLSAAELLAGTEAAHDAGRIVAVHAATAEGMRRAVAAGVDTIEHGYGGTRETFTLMAKKGIAYLPTLTVCEAICEYFMGYMRGGEPHPRMVEAANAFRTARAEGVVIGCGSDVGPFPHGENRRELEWMIRLGMSRDEALLAATAVNANIIRRDHELGSVKEGYLADLIATTDDLDVRFVMKAGAVFLR